MTNPIIGYTYKAELLCPSCLIETLIQSKELSPFARDMAPEEALDILAIPNIDRADEYSFDSDEFPKVVLSHQVETPTVTCDRCGEVL